LGTELTFQAKSVLYASLIAPLLAVVPLELFAHANPLEDPRLFISTLLISYLVTGLFGLPVYLLVCRLGVPSWLTGFLTGICAMFLFPIWANIWAYVNLSAEELQRTAPFSLYWSYMDFFEVPAFFAFLCIVGGLIGLAFDRLICHFDEQS
jgi:hypothetical protein